MGLGESHHQGTSPINCQKRMGLGSLMMELRSHQEWEPSIKDVTILKLRTGGHPKLPSNRAGLEFAIDSKVLGVTPLDVIE